MPRNWWKKCNRNTLRYQRYQWGEGCLVFKIQCQIQKLSLKRMSCQELSQPQVTEVAGFIAKTFQILNNEEFAKIAYWAPSGTEFIIKDVTKFQTIVLPRYFRHSKMNSFIRQLNMYGFHKSRADHSKSVFSHPCFLKGRDDLLILIRRKIKGKLETKPEEYPQTPLKPRPELEINTTASKRVAQTGHELVTEQQLVQLPNNVSFNLLGTRERLGSLLNLNFTINRLPLADLGEPDFGEEEDDAASIADKIEEGEEFRKERQAVGASYRFMNPSCFFDSIHRLL